MAVIYARVSFVSVFQPMTVSPDKYGLCVMVNKDDKKTKKICDEEIQAAIKRGVEKGKFPASAIPHLKLPWNDGDAAVDMKKRGPEFKNHWYINANRRVSDGPPEVVDSNNVPLMDPGKLYSGCWCYLDIQFGPYGGAAAKGKQGVGCYLQNVMVYKDDTRLDGRQSATQAFADIPPANIEEDNGLPESGDLT